MPTACILNCCRASVPPASGVTRDRKHVLPSPRHPTSRVAGKQHQDVPALHRAWRVLTTAWNMVVSEIFTSFVLRIFSVRPWHLPWKTTFLFSLCGFDELAENYFFFYLADAFVNFSKPNLIDMFSFTVRCKDFSVTNIFTAPILFICSHLLQSYYSGEIQFSAHCAFFIFRLLTFLPSEVFISQIFIQTNTRYFAHSWSSIFMFFV